MIQSKNIEGQPHSIDRSVRHYGRRKKEPQTVNGETVMVPLKLLDLEKEILRCGVLRAVEGTREFYGYEIHRPLTERLGQKNSVKTGGLYKALRRLESWGMLESKIEPIEERMHHLGSTRILYSVTPAGAARIIS